MLRRDFARTTDSIGATDFYKMAMDFHDRQKQKELDANEIMSGYQKGVDMQRQNALADALQSGDEEAINKAAAAYDPQAAMQERLNRMAEQRKFDQQKELASINNQAALERVKQTYANKGGAGGYGNTQAGLALRIAENPDDYTPEMQAWSRNYLASNSSNAIYDKAYQGALGRKQAEGEFEKAANAYASSQRASNLSDILAEVQNMDRSMFTTVGEMQSRLSAIGEGFGVSNLGGMTEENRTKRSNIDAAIREVGQDLIARAKSKGQAGINTLAEIERIIGNLSMTSGRAELIGALQRLQEQERKLDALETVATPVPTYRNATAKTNNFDNVSNDELLGSVL